MTNQAAMDINTFCPVGSEIKTTDIKGETWIVLSEELSNSLRHPYSLRGLLPAHETRKVVIDAQDAQLVSERLFYQLVLASPATKAIEFRNWVATSLLWRWYENIGDPKDIYNAERLRYAPRCVMGAIEIIVSEYLPISRQQQISQPRVP